QLDGRPGDVPLSGLLIPFDSCLMQMPHGFRHQRGDLLANDLGWGTTKDVFGGRIDKDDFTRLVNRDDCVGGRFSQRAETLFAFAQRKLGAATFGHVSNDSAETCWLATAVLD